LVLPLVLILHISVLATDAPTTAPTTQPVAPAVTASNTKCPVSGDAVEPKGKTVAYQGKTIGFCCDDCIEPFNKNPEKYSKNLK
jgi:YHS domain-containing protein